MTKVFLGGSRKIARLNSEIRKRIDNVIAKGFLVLVGDASGADKALQKYLADKKYPNVTVYCSGYSCRNNVGGWKTEHVSSNRSKKDFEHYAKKDAQMGREAEYGLFLWDGKSKGTLNNIFTMTAQNKSAVVYFYPAKDFVNVKSVHDLEDLLTHCDPRIAETVLRRLSLDDVGRKRQTQLNLA